MAERDPVVSAGCLDGRTGETYGVVYLILGWGLSEIAQNIVRNRCNNLQMVEENRGRWMEIERKMVVMLKTSICLDPMFLPPTHRWY